MPENESLKLSQVKALTKNDSALNWNKMQKVKREKKENKRKWKDTLFHESMNHGKKSFFSIYDLNRFGVVVVVVIQSFYLITKLLAQYDKWN